MNSFNSVVEGIDQTITGFETIAEHGKYREKQELIQAVYAFDFFKNYPDDKLPDGHLYGEGFVQRLEQLEKQLANELKEEHVPEDLMELRNE